MNNQLRSSTQRRRRLHGGVAGVPKTATRRRGAAVVELALLLPVLLTVTFGSLEVCNRLFLRQTAAVAAYETARLAARRTVSSTQAVTRGLSLLDGRRIIGGQIVITPAGDGLATLPTGGQLTVQVTIPIAGNTPVSYVLNSPDVIRASAVMMRE